MSIFAIIPARGGSKRVPRKNILSLAGKPMIAWTIESALQATGLDRVIVSTDDAEIAEVSRSCGAEAPFLRPVEMASDEAKSTDVVLHVLDWLEQHGESIPTFILLLQPTSPLRTSEDIEAGITLQIEKKANAVVSVCEAAHPNSLLKKVGANGELLNFPGENPAEPMFQLNGAIYLVSTPVFESEKLFIPSGTYAYIMPRERSLDVDTPWDFHLTDLILRDKHASSYS